VADTGDWNCLRCVHQHVELDEAVAFALVIGGDDCACRQLIADMGGGEVLHSAADMHPRPQNDVMAQCPVADVQNGAGMDEIFPGIEKLGLAHCAQGTVNLAGLAALAPTRRGE
jgi:hypothetical protein